MATYQEGQHLTHLKHAAFDTEYSPGFIGLFSGIYRCVACGDEIAANKGNPLPPQNKHQHQTNAQIKWRLLVFAQQK